MFSGREYAVFGKGEKVQKGVSGEEIPMFLVNVKSLRKISGYVQLVFNRMKEIEVNLYDQYYGSAECGSGRLYDWELGIIEV
jgi:hypothetical protein